MPIPNNLPTVVSTALAAALVVSCASMGGDSADLGPLGTTKTQLGMALTDEKGMTLYTYKDDPDGQSVCYKRCARAWPPVKAAPGAKPTGKLSIIERKDGSRQYAYDGRPLYRWRKDKAAGDVDGHNKGEVWFLARP